MSKMCYFTKENYEYFSNEIYFNFAKLVERKSSINIEDISYVFKTQVATKSETPNIGISPMGSKVNFKIENISDTFSDGYREFEITFEIPINNFAIIKEHDPESIYTSILLTDITGSEFVVGCVFSINVKNIFNSYKYIEESDIYEKLNSDLSALYMYRKLKEYSVNSKAEINIKP